MTKSVRAISLIIMVLIAVLILAGCSRGFTSVAGGTNPTTTAVTGTSPSTGSTKGPTNGRVQSNDANAVKIDVKWAEAGAGSLVLDVSMNTHSVDLDQYDLKKLVVIRDDSGTEYRPTTWSAPSGGHHREGMLTFSLPDSVTRGETRYIEMVIKDVAGIKERVLKWQL